MQETNIVTYAKEVKDKTEKIVAGLHMLTNHLADNNLLKSEIRNTAVSLLSGVLEDKDTTQHISNLSSFIRVATLAQDISKDNAGIIITELAKVHGAKDTHGLNHIFTTKYETFEKGGETHSLASPFVPQESVALIEGVDNNKTSYALRQAHVQEQPLPKVKEYTSEMSPTFSSQSMKKDTTSNTKDMLKDASPRRQKIASLLSHSDAKSIKDVSRHFNDVSEKTIQRELNDMVEAKIIVRIGDRRWSTYKLR